MDPRAAMSAPNTSVASSGAAPWFSGAPWTKLLVCVWVLVFVLQRHLSPSRHVEDVEDEEASHHDASVPPSLPLILQFFAFDTTGDLVMGIGFLALQLRRLEREIGSVQFAEYMLLLVPIAFGIHQMLLILFGVPSSSSSEQRNIWNWIPPFPTLLTAAALHWYSYHTPRLYPNFITVFGDLKFSEKALMQLWGVYLLMHSHNLSPQEDEQEESWWLASNFMTTTLSYLLSGIVSSTLYLNVLVTYSSAIDPPLVLIPQWFVDKLPIDSLSSWLFLDPPPRIYAPALSGRGVPTRSTSGNIRSSSSSNNGSRRQRQAEAAFPAPPPEPVEPSPEAVTQLVSMGFPQDQVEGALRQTNNNVERAADLLLMGS